MYWFAPNMRSCCADRVTQHDADQERHERRDAERLRARAIDVRGDFGPRNALRAPHQPDQVKHEAAEHGDAALQMLEEREQHQAEARDGIDTIDLFRLFTIRVKQRDPFEDFPLRVRERDALRQLPAPHAP
jgi:hypothetical protein